MESETDTPRTSRSEYAEDRTILANERTFAAWLRTGFAGIGIGLAFNALFNRLEPSWLPRLIATAFLVVAIIIFVAAERRACAVLARLEPHSVKTIKVSNVRLIMIVSVSATLALIAAIWLLGIEPVAVRR